MKLGKVIAHIPARGGSKRVPSKNKRYLLEKPLLAYAIKTALGCSRLDEVYVNTDSDDLEELAKHYGCDVYRRPEALGRDDASGDDFTIDFMINKNPDTLMMISPVCPLIEVSDVKNALDAYEKSDADTLISCSKTQMQTFCESQPVNINPNGPLTPTQVNPPVLICNWAITIWNVNVFKHLYNEFGGGYCGKNRLLWPIAPWKSIKISNEDDFVMAEKLMMSGELSEMGNNKPRYWSSQDAKE